ncbi:MAG: glycerol-3-phosphate dehydrogenase (NAD(P)+) [bacterium]|jgi:glycerol-3-phosphate dehydrogenase (NAD(P)+)
MEKISAPDKIKNVTVLGAGRWGSAVAIFISRKENVQVTLQCYSDSTYQYAVENDCSPRLTQYSFEKKIKMEQDLNESIKDADLVVISTPVPFLRDTLEKIKNPSKKTIFVGINKGIENGTLKTVPEIVGEYLPNHFAQLGGPCFPQGLLSDITPVAETVACSDMKVAKQLQEFFSTRTFRVYRSTEVIGVALLGAIKNVFAIAAGIIDGYGLYEEALSVLMSRGLAEMRRFCTLFGISQETLYGLSGLGDLALTCYSPGSSHNKNFGKKIGQGQSVEEILADLGGSVAEGYYTTKALYDLGQKHKISIPLTDMIYRVLYENLSIEEGLYSLMSRPLKEED